MWSNAVPEGDQADVIRFLACAPDDGGEQRVEIIETHISRIFLWQDRAFKMKRAVTLPYADFSTPALRLETCRKEVELNRRTAPDLYTGVRRIVRAADGTIGFDGQGELVDAVVEMRRFDQTCLLDRMAMAGTLDSRIARQTASAIADFHRQTTAVHAGGGAANLSAVLDINLAGFATSHVFNQEEVAALDRRFREAVARHALALDRREAQGKVRHCHGDLHLRNICLIDGRPVLFDCIEFNDGIATVDVLYDLAFLLMDLWHRGAPELANLVMNRYLDESGEDDGFGLLPLFMAVRAAVRAHVVATQAETGKGPSGALAGEARSYFTLAATLLNDMPARLIAVGGRSGSGKSTIAEALAHRVGAPPGARVVESDRLRKALHKVAAETRLPQSAYRAEVSRRVYEEMAGLSDLILFAGGCVIANAVFDRPVDRQQIEDVATGRACPFAGFWLEADAALLRRRVEGRLPGASDATVDVLEGQLTRDPGEMTWRHLDAGRDPSESVADILAAIRDAGAAIAEGMSGD